MWQHDAEADQKNAVTESTYHVTDFKAQPNSFWPFETKGQLRNVACKKLNYLLKLAIVLIPGIQL